MSFRNEIAAGPTLIRQALQSPDYSLPPVSQGYGWRIARDGTAFLANPSVRAADLTSGNYAVASLTRLVATMQAFAHIVNAVPVGDSVSTAAFVATGLAMRTINGNDAFPNGFAFSTDYLLGDTLQYIVAVSVNVSPNAAAAGGAFRARLYVNNVAVDNGLGTQLEMQYRAMNSSSERAVLTQMFTFTDVVSANGVVAELRIAHNGATAYTVSGAFTTMTVVALNNLSL